MATEDACQSFFELPEWTCYCEMMSMFIVIGFHCLTCSKIGALGFRLWRALGAYTPRTRRRRLREWTTWRSWRTSTSQGSCTTSLAGTALTRYTWVPAVQKPLWQSSSSSCPENTVFQAFSELTMLNNLTDLHREHLDCGEPFPETASSVWRSHDGAVQGRHLWGAQPPSLCDRRCLLQVCVFGYCSHIICRQ